MAQSKLTVRVDRRWIEPAKRYAARHHTSLSKLISEYLRMIGDEERSTSETPILDRLTGVLPEEAGKAEHRRHLEEKYLGK